MRNTPVVEFDNISKGYGSGPVLKNVSLRIEPGKITGLTGPNGHGKSTLLKLAAGLIQPDAGSVKILGTKPGAATKSLVSYLPERNMLDLSWKVKNALNFYADFYEDFDRNKALDLLKKLGLSEDMKLKNMSKGMLEKLQLILVMSRKAMLYILDEPLGGVDPAARDYILDTILQNFDEGASMIISTHLIADIERILDNVIFLKNGEVVINDDADALRLKKGGSIDEIFRKEFKCQ